MPFYFIYMQEKEKKNTLKKSFICFEKFYFWILGPLV